jgi:hypothetical protein
MRRIEFVLREAAHFCRHQCLNERLMERGKMEDYPVFILDGGDARELHFAFMQT